MNKEPEQDVSKSPWPRRLAVGCGGLVLFLVVGLFALNLIAKKVIAGKIEEEIAKNGWQADVGEFDYSIRNKEVEIREFKGVPLNRKELEELGEVQVDHARVKFDGDRKDKIGEVYLEGARSKLGEIDRLEVKPERSIEIEGLTFNNPKEFGGGPLFNLRKVSIEYGNKHRAGQEHFRAIHLEVARINIVKNQAGKWLTDGAPQAQVKIQEENGEMPLVDDISIVIDEIAFQDLSQGDSPKIIKVNKTVQIKGNPKGYGLPLFLRLIGIVAGAKNEAGL